MAIQKKSLISNLNSTKRASSANKALKGDASVVDKGVASRAMLSKTVASRSVALSKNVNLSKNLNLSKNVNLSKNLNLSKIALSKNLI